MKSPPLFSLHCWMGHRTTYIAFYSTLAFWSSNVKYRIIKCSMQNIAVWPFHWGHGRDFYGQFNQFILRNYHWLLPWILGWGMLWFISVFYGIFLAEVQAPPPLTLSSFFGKANIFKAPIMETLPIRGASPWNKPRLFWALYKCVCMGGWIVK